MIELTLEQLNEYTKNKKTSCIALNAKQLKLLGIDWPPSKGWVKHLIGLHINNDTHRDLLKLKGGVNLTKQLENKRKKLEAEVKKAGGKCVWMPI